jgi:hypothetical protein
LISVENYWGKNSAQTLTTYRKIALKISQIESIFL